MHIVGLVIDGSLFPIHAALIKAKDEEALVLVGADLPIESEQESNMGNTFYLPYNRFQLKDGKHIGSTSSSNRRLFSSPALSRMEALF